MCEQILVILGVVLCAVLSPVRAQVVTENQQLFGSNGGDFAEFGADVALVETETETLALVGAPGDAERGFSAGAVYSYRYDEATDQWVEEAKFWPEDFGERSGAGFSVAISDDGGVAFVASTEPGPQAAPHYGRVHVFLRGEGAWVETATLSASDETPYNSFGCSVAPSADGSVVVVGACSATGSRPNTGAVYIFRRQGETNMWMEEAKVTTERACFFTAFGASVDISAAGERVVVTEPCGEGGDPSAVYFFHRAGGDNDPNGGWVRETLFEATGGGAVALSDEGDLALVGLRFTSRVEIFEREGAGWSETGTITSGSSSISSFGRDAIALDGEFALIGDQAADVQNENEGAAFLFRHSADGAWVEEAILVASDGALNDDLGRAVALSEHFALAGAPFRGGKNAAIGITYAYDLTRIVSMEQVAPAADALTLSAYPNPFVYALTLAYTLPHAERVRLAVYDVLGREVAVLAEGLHEAGRHKAEFDASHLASGVYVIRAEVVPMGGSVQAFTQKLTLLK